ncbi:MAG: hypothetical protein EHM41_04575 [Chloroflexi bacterium]|nr:MAG: hypothetical protein EHM41_04575 [Chloroflexota bacterium]
MYNKAMKMIVAVIHDKDNEPVTQALITKNYRVTRIASSGGFLRRGNTTLMIGVENNRVDDAIGVIRDSCSQPGEPGIKRASLFVLDISKFDQL